MIVTGHQAFFTGEAIGQIMVTTPGNVSAQQRGKCLRNAIPLPVA